MRKVLCLLLLSLMSLNANAAWYQVEIIIFENLYPQSNSEIWSSQRGLPLRSNYVELLAEDAAGDKPVAFKRLRSSQFNLGGVYNELKVSKNYRPLLHLSWQQPGRSGSGATAVHIRNALNTASSNLLERQVKLDGTVGLRVSRFLHMDVDLVYLLEAANSQTTDGESFKQPSTSYTRLRESRRMKLNELHYFDHPLFGMITRVSRLNVE